MPIRLGAKMSTTEIEGEDTMNFSRVPAIVSAIVLIVGGSFAQNALAPIQSYSQVAGLWHGTTKHGTKAVLQFDANGECFVGTTQGVGKCSKVVIKDGSVRAEWSNGTGYVTLNLTSAGTLEGRLVNGQYVTDNMVYTKQ
jgi:hypothetical protein